MDESFTTFDLLTNVETVKKENVLQHTVVDIKHKYGKNAILMGTSFQDKATGRERNKMVGGHNSGEDE